MSKSKYISIVLYVNMKIDFFQCTYKYNEHVIVNNLQLNVLFLTLVIYKALPHKNKFYE